MLHAAQGGFFDGFSWEPSHVLSHVMKQDAKVLNYQSRKREFDKRQEEKRSKKESGWGHGGGRVDG
eukprot:509889-Karenia_brevis.AAC.1